jgi:hypothetical protein
MRFSSLAPNVVSLCFSPKRDRKIRSQHKVTKALDDSSLGYLEFSGARQTRLQRLHRREFMAAGCKPPPAPEPGGAAEVALPPAVAASVEQLREIGVNRSYRDMPRLADQTPGFRSNKAGMSHSEYWYLKMLTGDWPMAQMERLLAFTYAVRPSSRVDIDIWPLAATLPPDQITPAVARDINRLLGEGQADATCNGLDWPGYVLSVSEDGTRLRFLRGAG